MNAWEYIITEWQRSPNPAWYKGLALLAMIGGMAWALWMVVDAARQLIRLRKLERLLRDTQREYDAMIQRHRNGAA